MSNLLSQLAHNLECLGIHKLVTCMTTSVLSLKASLSKKTQSFWVFPHSLKFSVKPKLFWPQTDLQLFHWILLFRFDSVHCDLTVRVFLPQHKETWFLRTHSEHWSRFGTLKCFPNFFDWLNQPCLLLTDVMFASKQLLIIWGCTKQLSDWNKKKVCSSRLHCHDCKLAISIVFQCDCASLHCISDLFASARPTERALKRHSILTTCYKTNWNFIGNHMLGEGHQKMDIEQTCCKSCSTVASWAIGEPTRHLKTLARSKYGYLGNDSLFRAKDPK